MNTLYVTKRLQIHIPLRANIALYVSWLNDPEVVKYSEQRHIQHTTETQIEYLCKLPKTSTFLEIMDVSESPIGTMTIHRDPNNGIADVGILIGDKSKWNNGFGFEAWECVCDDLFQHGVRKIEAGCMLANKGMVGIFMKYGMFCDGIRAEHFLIEDMTSDMVMYGKFKK